MLPACLFTVRTPSCTTHCAGEWSWVDTHWLSSLPSNRTTASEGASRPERPGVTTPGTGFQTSVSSGRGVAACADAEATAATNSGMAMVKGAFMTELPCRGLAVRGDTVILQPAGRPRNPRVFMLARVACRGCVAAACADAPPA